jgi:hypothetical protein
MPAIRATGTGRAGAGIGCQTTMGAGDRGGLAVVSGSASCLPQVAQKRSVGVSSGVPHPSQIRPAGRGVAVVDTQQLPCSVCATIAIR